MCHNCKILFQIKYRLISFYNFKCLTFYYRGKNTLLKKLLHVLHVKNQFEKNIKSNLNRSL